MKKPTVVFVLTFLLMGCATYPPPKIENGYYQNYRYGFALDLPGSDWVLMEKPPPQLTGVTPRKMRKQTMLALFNKEISAAIIVVADKIRSSPALIFQSASMQAAMLAEFSKHPEVKDARDCHDSSTYMQDWDTCIEFDFEDAVSKSKGNVFVRLFPVGNHVHMIMVVFSSNHITYEQSFPAFVELVKSIRQGDEYTISELTMERERKRLEKQRLEPEKEQLAYIPEDLIARRIHLRNQPRKLTIDDVKIMLFKYNFYDRDFNKEGHFINDFLVHGDGTVTDRATGLMWLVEAPAAKVKYGEHWSIDEAIKFFNGNRFAGYSDWRIPTIEELASILDPKGTDLLIPWVFRSPQSRVYISADTRVDTPRSLPTHWLVHFDHGIITSGHMWTTWRSNVLPFKAVRSAE